MEDDAAIEVVAEYSKIGRLMDYLTYLTRGPISAQVCMVEYLWEPPEGNMGKFCVTNSSAQPEPWHSGRSCMKVNGATEVKRRSISPSLEPSDKAKARALAESKDARLRLRSKFMKPTGKKKPRPNRTSCGRR